MEKKYKEFADEFEELCEKYKDNDFNAQEIISICKEVADNYSG